MKVLDDFVILDDNVDLLFATKGPRSHFFGYYDKSPFSGDGRQLLCQAVDFDGRIVQEGDKAEIGFWDLTDGSYTRLTETKAFNWQQGSMLQWLPGSNYKKIIFNERSKANFISVILDLDSGNKHFLPTTIYSLAPNGQYALTPRFERLYYCRPGYCYMGIQQPKWNGNLPPGDGIIRMDLRHGSHQLIMETAALANIKMKESVHYVEHIMVNPQGSQCIFFHRWFHQPNSIITRLYTCNLDGTELRLFPDSGFYSHANWINGDQFIIWGRMLGTYAKVRRSGFATKWLLSPILRFYRKHYSSPLIDKMKRSVTLDAFLLFSDSAEDPISVGKNILVGDGHPSICPSNSQLLLVDTYEDSQNYRHLSLYNMSTKTVIELGRFFSPPKFNQTGFRCDLHPRWSSSGGLVCIDTIQGDRRQMMVLDVTKVLEGL